MDINELSIQRMQDRIDQQTRTIDMLSARVRMLEEENSDLIAQLRRRGVDVRSSSKTAVELPPPVTEELEYETSSFQLLGDPEKRLAEELFQADPVYTLDKTETTADVGHWLSNGIVWAATTADRLILFAAGRRPYVEEIPFGMLRKSVYNQVTGEIVLGPAKDLKTTKLRMPPAPAYQLLAQIYQQEETNA